MTPAPRPWQLELARIDGALPFLSEPEATLLARRSLRRLWAHHVRAYPFENTGPDHDPGLDAGELVRSPYAAERDAFLSWIARRAAPPLAEAARSVLAAKGVPETFAHAYAIADTALDRLDALLPSEDPLAALVALVAQLTEHETAFLEGGSETYITAGRAFSRPPARGGAWAGSLAAALRPQLFALGAAPLALAGLVPREAFQSLRERAVPAILAEALLTGATAARTDIIAAHAAVDLGKARLAKVNRSSRARDAWLLLAGLGPLTRAEIARTLGVTKRTASQAAATLEKAGLIAGAGRHEGLRMVALRKN
ncbi:MAG: helix-turn-helix domain-containing protein [Sphingobium sp.]|uniref:helix-turn-helix domain-containing protein n=1 Tax=Sphingobium sp. TaxID=1912891 RepID=UPI0029B6F13F|nr:helix-turn-helix domain-containing protein [Sphingobium sp.]MDX3911285.1 helix-turn-helix domain-containing protein [Sphingobium sp.]